MVFSSARHSYGCDEYRVEWHGHCERVPCVRVKPGDDGARARGPRPNTRHDMCVLYRVGTSNVGIDRGTENLTILSDLRILMEKLVGATCAITRQRCIK